MVARLENQHGVFPQWFELREAFRRFYLTRPRDPALIDLRKVTLENAQPLPKADDSSRYQKIARVLYMGVDSPRVNAPDCTISLMHSHLVLFMNIYGEKVESQTQFSKFIDGCDRRMVHLISQKAEEFWQLQTTTDDCRHRFEPTFSHDFRTLAVRLFAKIPRTSREVVTARLYDCKGDYISWHRLYDHVAPLDEPRRITGKAVLELQGLRVGEARCKVLWSLSSLHLTCEIS